MNEKIFYKGYKYQIKPTEEQKKLINRFIDLYRFVYNWGIAKEDENYKLYEQGKSKYKFLNFLSLSYEFTKFRHQSENNWILELPLTTSRLALKDVVNAYTMFFNKHNKHPKFKSKKLSPKMFKTRSERFFLTENGIRIEGLPGRKDLIPMSFNCGFKKSDKIIQPVISIDNIGNYWVSFSVIEQCKTIEKPKTDSIGIDLGIRKTFTLSTGEVYNKPIEKLNKLDRRIKMISHHVSRDINRRKAEAERTKSKYDDIPKSKRETKREIIKRKLYKKKHDIKNNFYHEVAKDIVLRNPDHIIMETIPVQNTVRKKQYMAKSMSQADFYWIMTIVKQKAKEYGVDFIQADRNFPSSQICSHCGHIQNIGNKKVYKCKNCGLQIDRDLNAALNLRDLVVQNNNIVE